MDPHQPKHGLWAARGRARDDRRARRRLRAARAATAAGSSRWSARCSP